VYVAGVVWQASGMKIDLTAEQEAWLATRVEEGEFPSMEAAVQRILDDRIALQEADLAWAKPLINEALAEVERGETLTIEEHDARIDALMARLKS
jgi:antitoxin ParD1/3/4